MAAGNVTYEIDFAAQIARLVQGTEQGGAAVKQMAEQVKSASDFAKSALEALGVTLSVHYFEEMIAGAIEARAHLADLSLVAGTTAEAFSRFEEPARTSSTSLDTVASSVAKLSRSIGEARLGDVDKQSLLRAMGIDPNDGRDAADVMFDLSTRLAGMTDQNIAAKVSTDLLGKSFAELRPFMAELRENGLGVATTTNEQAAAAKALKDEYARLQLQTDLNKRQLAEGMLPALKDVVGAFQDAQGTGEAFNQVGETIGTVLKGIAAGAIVVVATFDGIGKAIATQAAAVSALMHGNVSEAINIVREGIGDIAGDAAAATERINKLFDESQHAKNAAAAGGSHDNADKDQAAKDAQDRAQALFEARQNYAANIAAAKAFGEQIAAQMKLNNALLQETYQQGEMDQVEYLREQAANNDAALAAKITSLQKEHELAVDRGDRARAQITANGIAQAEAERQAQALIAKVRVDAALEHEQDDERKRKQKLAQDADRIHLEVMTEKTRLNQAYADKQTLLENAHANELISDAQFHADSEALEMEHQAALGDLTAQGQMQRRQLNEMSAFQQLEFFGNTLASVTAAGAQHNRTMFELNKAANISNAIISTYAGATKALEWGFPLGPIFAGIIAAAGFVNVAAISAQSFGGGAAATSATPVFAANPNTSQPVQAPPTPSNGITAPGGAAPAPTVFNVTLVGETVKTEQVRDLMAMMKDQLPYGATLNIEMTPS